MVVLFVAGQANTSSATTGGDVGVIDSDVDLVIIGVDQAGALRGALIYEGHVSVGWVASLR